MRLHSQPLRRHLMFAVASSLLLVACHAPAWGDPPANVASPAASPLQQQQPTPPNVLSPEALDNDPALQVKVSFEVKRQPLETLLADLRQQSGVPLRLEPNGQPNVLTGRYITAHVKGISLAEFMSALTRLYTCAWVKDDKGYVVTTVNASALQRAILQVGEPGWFRSSPDPAFVEAIRQKQQAWGHEIVDQLDREKLFSKEGVPLSDLPQDLLARLRQKQEDRGAFGLVRAYYATAQALKKVEGATVSIEQGNNIPKDNVFYDARVHTADGFTLATFRLGRPAWMFRLPGPIQPQNPKPKR